MNESCLICDRIQLWRNGENPYLVHEFEHSILVVGDHQYHRGYSLVLLKDHVRELHILSPRVQQQLFSEVMEAGQAVYQTFQPWKMNYSCYGNTEEHVRWHIFPRYESDPDHKSYPWLHASDFKNHVITPQTAQELASKIKENL